MLEDLHIMKSELTKHHKKRLLLIVIIFYQEASWTISISSLQEVNLLEVDREEGHTEHYLVRKMKLKI